MGKLCCLFWLGSPTEFTQASWRFSCTNCTPSSSSSSIGMMWELYTSSAASSSWLNDRLHVPSSIEWSTDTCSGSRATLSLCSAAWNRGNKHRNSLHLVKLRRVLTRSLYYLLCWWIPVRSCWRPPPHPPPLWPQLQWSHLKSEKQSGWKTVL